MITTHLLRSNTLARIRRGKIKQLSPVASYPDLSGEDEWLHKKEK